MGVSPRAGCRGSSPSSSNQAYSVARPIPSISAASATRPFASRMASRTTTRGDLVRSKSEVIIANELLHRGFPRYVYEKELVLPDGKTRYPDVTIENDDTGEVFYWEHLGLLHNPEYERRWKQKLADYRDAGILPVEEGGGPAGSLITTRDDPGGGIDAQRIAELISAHLGGR